MAKQKREKMWNDGMWKLDDDYGCHCCYWWYTGVNGECCNASGKRFEGKFCKQFEPRLEDHKPDSQQKYESYMDEWN